MTFDQFLLFMLVPVGGLTIGYIAMRLAERDTERFDRHHPHPGE